MKYFIDAGTHEVNDLLRGVDDAMCISLLDREPLKEAFIHGIEEVLFLSPIIKVLCCIFNSDVEAICRFFKITSIKGTAGQSLDHLFDLSSNDVPTAKIRIIKNCAEKPFS